MKFPGELWLEQARLAVQSGFFAVFLLALGLSLGAVWQRRSPLYNRVNHWFWAASMLVFAGMWATGATLEMMRRAAVVSGTGLIVALIAFSVLLAGVVSLVIEWFPRHHHPRFPRASAAVAHEKKELTLQTSLRGDRIATSLIALSLVGWWFGGFALPWNALFALAPFDSTRTRFPDGWVLAVAGAQLLAVAQMVQSHSESHLRTINVRQATWWLFGFVVLLAWTRLGAHAYGASVAGAGFVAFLLKVWGVRRETQSMPRPLRRVCWLLVPLALLVPLWLGGVESWPSFAGRLGAAWKTVPSVLAFAAFLVCFFGYFGVGRPRLRRLIQTRFSARALLLGVLVGLLPATFFFGPTGALWWSFFPLAGLFYDLLAVYEQQHLESFPREASDDSVEPESALEPATAVPAGSGQAEVD